MKLRFKKCAHWNLQ